MRVLFPVYHTVEGVEYTYTVHQEKPKSNKQEVVQYSSKIAGGDQTFKYSVFLRSLDILANQATKDIVEQLVVMKVREVLDQKIFKDQAFFVNAKEIKDTIASMSSQSPPESKKEE